MKHTKDQYLFGILRLLLGAIFFWAFFDKVFGLGFATASDKSWLNGVSPTAGFLANTPTGPFADVFRSLSGVGFMDWLFMGGLFCIGLALLLGIGMRIASYAGSVFLVLVWLAVLPPAHHPLIDEHIVYAMLLLLLSSVHAGKYLGFGIWWGNTRLVQSFPWLR